MLNKGTCTKNSLCDRGRGHIDSVIIESAASAKRIAAAAVGIDILGAAIPAMRDSPANKRQQRHLLPITKGWH